MDQLTILECIMYSLIGFAVVFTILLVLAFGTMLISKIVRSITEQKPEDTAAKSG